MTRDEVITTIRTRRAAFEAAGVRHVWLFGSTVRGTASQGSDVDLYFEPGPAPFGLVDYARARAVAAETLPFPVDLVLREALHPAIRPRIEAEAVPIF